MALLILLSACNLARDVGDGETTGDPVADSQTQIAQAVILTQTAIGPATPTNTFTPSLTPTITFTSTPDKLMLTVSTETNCRTGPGVPYDIIAVLMPGTPAEVVGKNASGDTWIIKLPSNPSVTCWLWGQFATVVGDTSGLTVYTPPPTPTPSAGFTFAYKSIVNCMGWFGFRFELTNNGSVTWQSFLLTVIDTDTSTTKTYSADEFVDSTPTCTPTVNLKDLTTGETGVAGNWAGGTFNYSPVGHDMTATIKLCSLDGLTGTCLEKTITFTP